MAKHGQTFSGGSPSCLNGTDELFSWNLMPPMLTTSPYTQTPQELLAAEPTSGDNGFTTRGNHIKHSRALPPYNGKSCSQS